MTLDPSTLALLNELVPEAQLCSFWCSLFYRRLRVLQGAMALFPVCLFS